MHGASDRRRISQEGENMHAISVSLVGVAVSEVRLATTAAGVPIARFRMVCQPRRYDSAAGGYVDLDASFVTVVAWRHTAENMAASVRKGEPVVVVGKLRVREFEADGRNRVTVEVDATSVGHDLSRGRTVFARPPRQAEGARAGHGGTEREHALSQAAAPPTEEVAA